MDNFTNLILEFKEKQKNFKTEEDVRIAMNEVLQKLANLFEINKVAFPAKSGSAVPREAIFLEGKEGLVGFPYFIPGELHGHRVVALRPGKLF